MQTYNFLIMLGIKCMAIKVHSSFSKICYRKTKTNFLANPKYTFHKEVRKTQQIQFPENWYVKSGFEHYFLHINRYYKITVALESPPLIGFLVAQTVKNLPAMWKKWVQSLGEEDPLEEGIATHLSILAWRIPWTEEPEKLQYIGSDRVGHE